MDIKINAWWICIMYMYNVLWISRSMLYGYVLCICMMYYEYQDQCLMDMYYVYVECIMDIKINAWFESFISLQMNLIFFRYPMKCRKQTANQKQRNFALNQWEKKKNTYYGYQDLWIGIMGIQKKRYMN